MKKFIKITAAITLLLFMGQTYASVLMSCNVSLNSMPASSHHSGGQEINHDNHVNKHLNNHQNNSEVSIDRVVFEQDCEAGQHACQCALGHCTSHVLPTTELLLSYIQDIQIIQDPESLTSYHASLPYRPPISA